MPCCWPSAGGSPRRGRNSAASGPRLIAPLAVFDRTCTEPGERELAERFERNVTELRQLGEQVVSASSTAGLFDLYHDRVNPALRRVVATADELREMQFRSMTQAGIEAEDQARWAMWVVAGIAVGALLLSSCIAVMLTRRVVGPVYLLTQAADAIGTGDFERRVDIRSPDELGHLAAGFNRMAAALAEIQRINVGQVLEVKGMLEATLEAVPDAVILFDPQGASDLRQPGGARGVGLA